MILLALLIGTLGAADLFRSRDAAFSWRTVGRSAIIATVLLVPATAGVGLAGWWALIGITIVAAWTATTTLVIARPRIHPWPIVGLAVVIAAILASNSVIPVAAGWLPDWYASLGLNSLADVPFDRAALIAAALLFLCESTNIIVRMVLSGSEKDFLASEKTLRGGRILGPIERIFIFAMALAGEFLAISAVVAAKGIFRFPEISKDGTTGTKAEYVLVGSFVSWGVALVFVPLLK